MKHTTRLLPTFLALVLASSLCGVPAYAEESASPLQGDNTAQNTELSLRDGVMANEGIPVQESAESVASNDELSASANEALASTDLFLADGTTLDSNRNAAEVGSLRVQVIEGLELNREVELNLDLAGSSYQDSKTVGFAATPDGGAVDEVQPPAQSVVSFDALPQGSYELTVSGDNFVTYRQTIEVGTNRSTVVLYTGTAAFTQDSAHPGIVVYGDATGDGFATPEDSTAILTAIDKRVFAGNDKIPAGEEGGLDLNADGFITLADLQYAAEALNKEQVLSTVEQTLVGDTIEGSISEDSKIAGGKQVVDVIGNVGDPVEITAPQNITEDKPLALSFVLQKGAVEPPLLGGMTVASPQTGNAIASGVVVVEYNDDAGQPKSIEVPIGKAARNKAKGRSVDVSKAAASITADGTIVVDFGGQIAVKKVTITITATSNNGNLAEITKVEFLNNMQNKIPEPQMDIPANLAAVAASKEFTVSWDAAHNITSYELSVSADGKEEVKRTTATSLSISSFNNDKILNGTEFSVKIQSVNGTWRSGWSDVVKVVPKTDKVPDAPEGLALKGLYQGFSASWKDMKDTNSYTLFYREKGTTPYTEVKDIKGFSAQVSGLKDNTEYQVYVKGVNEIGVSSASSEAVVATVNVKPAQLPQYRLVNTQNADGSFLDHIVSASYGRGSMVDSPLDEGVATPKSALGLFDNSYTSYLSVKDWDEGGAYPTKDKGVTVTFDEDQTLGMISFAEVEDGITFGYSNVQYVDESGVWKGISSSIQMRTCENGRKYALVKFESPVTTKQIKLGFGRASDAQRIMSIAEMRFHAYDSLESDIMGLYSDDLHLVLQESVTTSIIDDLQNRLDTPDASSSEFHPYRAALQVELTNARTLFETKNLENPVQVHTAISAQYDKRNLGITGLNAWQPLGVVAGAGDEIVVYAGAEGVATGTNAPLRLVVGQQHHEYTIAPRVVTTLKAGRNEITIPALSSLDLERGGQLYIEYTGANANASWGVRVSGATAVPYLDLYQVTDQVERLERVKTYVQELEAFVPELEKRHNELHRGSSNSSLAYDYKAETCILNATDIMLDQMMYSVPVQQMLAGSGTGSTDQRAARLLSSFDAMDQMMELFYQHKGLLKADDAANINMLPSQHLNIRYTTMFAGAFMYAASNHIGIEWGSVPGLCGSNPIVLDESGAKVSGNLFGWGIAHEVGHNINQSQYAVLEVTNNYFAQLTATDETNATARAGYDSVYKLVTSGINERSGGVGTQLSMYWQLRLFYDTIDHSPFKLYDSYQDTFDNRVFARIDSFARNPEAAPAPGMVKLTLSENKDQNIIRLASAATQRNLTEFFTRWGLIPDEASIAYLAQFDAEEHAVYYINDDARAYARTHPDSGLVSGKNVVASNAQAQGSEVEISLGTTLSGDSAEAVLGYEIARLTLSGGQQQREVVGFSTSDSFVDIATAMSNRTVSYEITAIDKYLNRSAPFVLDALKIEGDGLQQKDDWTASTNMVSEQDVILPPTEDEPDAPIKQPAIDFVLDGSADTTYVGVSQESDPSITIDMGKSTELTALRIAFANKEAAQGSYRIESSMDGQSWTSLHERALNSDNDGVALVYFDNGKDPWICTYDARYVRITALGQVNKKVSIKDVDVFGPSGDNVELLSSESGTALGILDEDFVYEEGADGEDAQFIPKGSIVFTGSYKGNPAYNVVVLYDSAGKIVGGSTAEGNLIANQIIMAPAPEDSLLGNTSEGRWVYWIDPTTELTLPTEVRAELYRVDNALTNVGQRLVSDTLSVNVPKDLPSIHLQNTSTVNQSKR